MKPYKDFLKELFPQYERVRKVSLNAGFSCPSFCAYCNNNSFSLMAKTEIPILEQLEAGIKNIRKKNTGILAYFQSYTNTNAPVQKLNETFSPVISHSEVAGLAIGTRPDCLPEHIVALLAELNKIKPIIVEIGVQTANDETLKNINRNHSAECARNAAMLCKNWGLATTAHIILGLPGENTDDFINTAKLVKDCGFSSIKIHPLHIVNGTRFADEYKKGKIKLLSFEEYCEAAVEVVRIVSPDIAIERISAESPKDILVAPNWSGDRGKIGDYISKLLQV